MPMTIEQLSLLTEAYLAFYMPGHCSDPKTRDYDQEDYESLVKSGALIRAFVNDEDDVEGEERPPIVVPHEHGTVLFITQMGRDVIDAFLNSTKLLD